jgi:hypothetical protein
MTPVELGSQTTRDVPARLALAEVLLHQVSSNDEVEPSLPTKDTRHILIGKYTPENPAEKRVIADFSRRNASFEHSSNKQQFPLFESHISPAFSKTNPEYFKRKICSQYPVAGIVRRNPPGEPPEHPLARLDLLLEQTSVWRLLIIPRPVSSGPLTGIGKDCRP